MIYLTKGVKQRKYQIQQDMSDFEHLVQTTREPQQALGLSADDLSNYKLNTAQYAIYGDIRGNSRTDVVAERTVLFIDVDDEGNYMDVRNRIATLLGSFAINYVIYPTISNGIKTGARLRVGIELDHPVGFEDYFKLWRVITTNTNIRGDESAVKQNFKQLQGLFVQTTQNMAQEPIVDIGGRALPVDEFVQIYENNRNKYCPKFKATSQRTKGQPRWANKNRDVIANLIDPESNYQLFGGWDNMLTAVGGWTFRNTHGNVRATAEIIEAVNDKGSVPIAEDELGRKFKSWVKNWEY